MFENLPSEIKLRIFNFLNLKELKRIASVSTEWKNLTKDKAFLYKQISDKKFEYFNFTFEENGEKDRVTSRTIKFLGASFKEQLDKATENYKEGNIFIDLFSEEEVKNIGQVELTVKHNALLMELKKIIPENELKFKNHNEKDESTGHVRYRIELIGKSTKIFLQHYSPHHGIRKMFI
jgi:hypothetical protein